ncbi:MAG: ADP-ribosylglycohydrolase family protein [Eubacteriales bacterium]|nr:ADP-ribosylglycohydrolase family protein [Clostridiales bacterium]MDY5835531.1 ADP-ribosylglycohydrolase family protein [Eubacteriales bacterium]
MRVSPVAWLFDDLGQVIWAARLQAGLTHNHPEGLKGAEAVAACIFLARQEASKAEIKHYVRETFAYNLDRSLDDIRPSYGFEVSCQHSVPEAILAFLEGQDFEDCIRNAVSLGGDADTQAAIAGSIAEAYYGLSDTWRTRIEDYLPDDLLEVVRHFQKSVK